MPTHPERPDKTIKTKNLNANPEVQFSINHSTSDIHQQKSSAASIKLEDTMDTHNFQGGYQENSFHLRHHHDRNMENNLQQSNTSPEQKSSKPKRKYNFQRATVACEQCRKAKTRCNYIKNGSTCFRCENLSLKCSLNEINIEPTLSSFQKSANITTRDEVEEMKASKKRRKRNSKPNLMISDSNDSKVNNNNLPSCSNTDQVTIKQENISPPTTQFSSSDSALLHIINNKIDDLSSSLKSLIDQRQLLSSVKTINPLNSISSLPTPSPNYQPQSQQQQQQQPTQQNLSQKLGKYQDSTQPYTSTTLPSLPYQLPSQSQNASLSNGSKFTSILNPPRPNLQFSGSSGFTTPNSTSSIPQIMRPPIMAPLARPYFQNINFVQHSNYPPSSSTYLNNFATNNGQNFLKNPNVTTSLTPISSGNMVASTIMDNSNTSTSNNSVVSNINMVHENDEFFFLNAPYLDMSNVACNLGLPFTKEIGFDISTDSTLLSIQERYDLINRKLLDYDSCYKLVETALLHYGKWITYVETDFKSWFDSTRIASPLLFSVLVLLGLRHDRLSSIEKQTDLDILQTIHQLLSLTIYEVPQTKEFIQVSILLTHFSPSLSYKHIYFDSWWMSSYGLIHFMTREMNMNLLVKSVKSPERIHQYRLWNHLTLSQLINCILSGRPCIIDDIRLDQCRDILVLSEANSFDAIIVAEISIILTLYNSLQFPESLDVSMRELESTYSDWKYLTENASFGGIVTGVYFFGKCMLLRRFLLKHLQHKDQQPDYAEKCGEYLDNIISLIKIEKTRDDLLYGSDLLKQCFILCVFMLLQFKQLNIFTASNDYIIKNCIDDFTSLMTQAESKIYCFNGYYEHYSELLVRLKNVLYPSGKHISS